METTSSVSMNKKLLQAIKSGREDIFYNSRTWRKKRKQILERDNRECQMCKKEGKVSKADTVHHIKKLKDYPELGMTDENLISVCFNCHNILHERFGEQEPRINIPERW